MHSPFPPDFPLPTLATCDVLVAGSGSAGVCAALAAARSGVRVILIDSAPNIGGTAVSGLPLLTTNDFVSKKLSAGLLEEIMESLRSESAFDGNLSTDYYFCYDPDKYRLVLARKLVAAGVSTLTHTILVGVRQNNGTLTHVVVSQKEGFATIAAKTFIDCTGDADLAHLCGEPMQTNDLDGKTQPPTLIFFAAGIDTKAIDWLAVRKLWDELRPTEKWINPRLGPALSPPFSYPGKTGFHGFNVTRSLNIDATKTPDLIRMETDQREQVDEFFYKFLKKYIPAFKTAYITGTSSTVGIRESRRIRGNFILTADPILKNEKFPDAVAYSAYPIDRHNNTGKTDYRESLALVRKTEPLLNSKSIPVRNPGETIPPAPTYAIPFRVMIPAKTKNLLVSGRCISADETAYSALRVMGTTMPLGEATGIAAALMAQRNLPNTQIPIPELRSILKSRKAYIEN